MNDKEKIFECADFFMSRVALMGTREGMVVSALLANSNQSLNLESLPKKFLEAIALASPNLYRSLKKYTQSSPIDKKKTIQSILKYYLRVISRATPFGLFSFVDFSKFCEQSKLDFSFDDVGKKAKIDMQFLETFIEAFHNEVDLVKDLKVMVNPNSFGERNRLHLPRFNSKTNKYDTISVKNTAIIQQILKLAKEPILYSCLESKLCSIFASFNTEKVTKCLWELFKAGYLISELSFRIDQPFNAEAFVNLISTTPRLDGNLKTVFISNLVQLFDLIKTYESCDIGKGFDPLESILDNAAHVDYPLQVDAYLLGGHFSLTKRIKPLLEEVATAICSLNQYLEPRKSSFMGSYHEKFLEKYGTNRLVPVQEVINPTNGLGLPNTSSNRNDNINLDFSNMFKLNLSSSLVEIDVESIVKENLSDLSNKKTPSSVELFFELNATSVEEIDKGNFTIIMNPVMGSNQAGSVFGRFLYLWDLEKKTSLKRLLNKEESLTPHICHVEASFSPLKARTANVCFFEQVRNNQLKLHYHEQNSTTIGLEDLYIGANEQSLYLFSKQLSKEVRLVLSSAVNPDLAPPALQFMLNLCNKSRSHYNPFIFSNYSLLPYLPRLVYKNVILSSRRWYLTYKKLNLKDDAKPFDVESEIKKFLSDYSVPNNVLLTELDNKIAINLNVSEEFKILQDKFQRSKEIVIFESISKQNIIKSDEGSHVAEFVVPLVRKNYTNTHLSNKFYPTTEQIETNQRLQLPGTSDWFYIKIYLPSAAEKDFLVNYLKNFIDHLYDKKIIEKFFYIRFVEDRSHIRLRLKSSSAEFAVKIFSAVSPWLSHHRFNGVLSDFSINCYEREIERYGGPFCIDFAEDVFFADSSFCLNLIEELGSSYQPLEHFSAITIILILKIFFPELTEAIQFLQTAKDSLHLLKGSREDLKHLSVVCRSLILNNEIEDISDYFFNKSKNSTSLIHFISSLKKFKSIVDENSGLWNDKYHVFDSIVHMHCNRLLGTDSELEKKARILAYFVLNKYSHSLRKDFANT